MMEKPVDDEQKQEQQEQLLSLCFGPNGWLQHHDIGSEHADPNAKILFHILARSVVDPLEFKEVKMLATESLAKFPPPVVLPFVFAYLLAFLREAGLCGDRSSSFIADSKTVPDSCGLVTAKLMVYYLNRVFLEDGNAYKNGDITAKALAVLIPIMGLPCGQDSNLDVSLLADLQRGCIDCVALITLRLAALEEKPKVLTGDASASSIVSLLLTWIFGTTNGAEAAEAFKACSLLSLEDSTDLQLAYNCFEATVSHLEATQSENVAMSGLKVVGALIGKLPVFVSSLPTVEVQRLIDGYEQFVKCLVTGG
ncbi:unnamed protein product [Phytophthora fragariaefolia]|uniref:Unnamed protein product n=1 Tax=Phytophthora fragariaefolia TaxID=1490495 RepID=A0A9W7DA79_9STRA|nr:unnamed protein product [Phytophthora fragariaefolia]